MARISGIEHPDPDAWYHVMNRGASNCEVFPGAGDRGRFLLLLTEVRRRFPVDIHAYCLMGNHYHLLVRATQPVVCRAMRYLDGVYTQIFHDRNGGGGALFRGRCRTVVVRAGRHLVHVSRYIHLNPVLGLLVRRPEDWPFSSYRAYLDPAWTPSWLSTATILGRFGSIGARGRYREFVERGLDPGTRDPYGIPKIRTVFDDEEYREEIRRLAAMGMEPDPLDQQDAVPLSRIGRSICAVFGVPREALRPRTRGKGGEHVLVRGAFVHAARRLGGYRLHEIAAWFGYRSHASLVRAANRYAEQARRDPRLANRLDEVMKIAGGE